ncbi:KAP family P-loop NTPase fold protein [Sessilibacter corallicola]|uniref:KAP family P-loop NTPase fold protein n=1 Tax=Sessilibacter corallicola TaxID=2904075 RepID=UPI001E3833FD|nr:P-loop NTPase fold protein [Sessilibacter corallicola]MCE2027181.1 KAP family NTPase [Sessilibacter corallicola]
MSISIDNVTRSFSKSNPNAHAEREKGFDLKSFQDRIRNRTSQLYRRDKFLPRAIALRAVTRIFPALAVTGDFNYWLTNNENASAEKTNNKHQIIDNRAYNLLRLFQTLSLAKQICTGLEGDRSNYVDTAIEAARGSYAAANDAGDSVSAKAAHAVAYLGAYAAEADVCAPAFTYSYSIEAAKSSGYCDELVANIEQDLDAAKNSSAIDLLKSPLWHGAAPDAFVELYSGSFRPLVQAIASDSIDEKIVVALRHLLKVYESLAQLQIKSAVKQTISAETSSESDSDISDALNRKSLVNALVNKFTHKSNSGHLTVGLLGYWGSGKTRILDLLKERLVTKESNFIWGEFNAWAYEYTDNIQAGMAHEIINALTEFRVPYEPPIKKESNGKKESDGKKENDGKTGTGLKNEIYAYFDYLKYRLERTFLWNACARNYLAANFVTHSHPIKSIRLGAVLVVLCVLVMFIVQSWPDIYNAKFNDYKEFEGVIDGIIAANIAALGSSVTLVYFLIRQVKRLFSQPYTKELLTYVKMPSYAQHIGLVSEMRSDIALMCDLRLKKSLFGLLKPKRMIFVVDDLDRCSPEGIVKTLEAVRLILDIENVTVILAIDQRIALAALAHHYRELQGYHTSGDAKSIARDYLGKIIHIPINLPEPDFNSVAGYMSHVWKEHENPRKPSWLNDVMPGKTVFERSEQNSNNDENQEFNASILESETYQSIDELADFVLEEPVSESVDSEQLLEGLTDDQKAAFVYWTQQFQLVNPRQLKRLHNSYNLLQLVSEKNDTVVSNRHHLAFGYLVSLIALEFVNNQTNLKITKKLKCYLFSMDKVSYEFAEAYMLENNRCEIDGLVSDDVSIACGKARDIIEMTAAQFIPENPHKSKLEVLYDFVNSFVLPTIEVDEDIKPVDEG